MLPGKPRGLCVTFGWDYSSTASTMTAFFLGQMKLGSALLLPPGVGRWGEDQRKDMISSWRVGRIHPDSHPDPDWLDVRYFIRLLSTFLDMIICCWEVSTKTNMDGQKGVRVNPHALQDESLQRQPQDMLSLKGFKLVAYFETTNGSTCKWLLTTDKMVRKIGGWFTIEVATLFRCHQTWQAGSTTIVLHIT